MKYTQKVRTLAVTLFTIGSLAGGANAAISFTDLGGGAAEVSFDSITFTVTEDNDNFNFIVFENFFAADSLLEGIPVSGSLSVSVNGAPPSDLIITDVSTAGQTTLTLTDLDPNDLVFGSSFSFMSGDTVAVEGIDLNYISPALNTPIQVETLVVKLINNDGVAVSDSVIIPTSAIPEPSSSALLAMIGVGMFTVRRRSNI